MMLRVDLCYFRGVDLLAEVPFEVPRRIAARSLHVCDGEWLSDHGLLSAQGAMQYVTCTFKGV